MALFKYAICMPKRDTNLQRNMLHYLGNFRRIKGHRYSYMALYGRIQGHRKRGRPKNRWMDNIRDDCLEMDLETMDAPRLAASDRGECMEESVVGLSECAEASSWH